MAPLRDAVALVDDEARELALPVEAVEDVGQRAAVREALRRDVEQADAVGGVDGRGGAEAAEDVLLLVAGARRGEVLCE